MMSVRLTVIVLASGGGSAFAEGFDVPAVVPDADGEGTATESFVASWEAAEGRDADASAEEVLAGIGCSGPISGGSPESGSASCDARETIIVSPASLEI